MSDLLARLVSMADWDGRSGEPLGKVMREAAAEIERLTRELTEARAQDYRPMSDWQPIETAPTGADILVAYEDGTVDWISELDNDYDWSSYVDKWGPGGVIPTHWMPPPEQPRC